ncbi:hypothetical protein [Streptomyces sp. MJM1172]|uniref:hypothetical protein n=1 Tax=Streptomyces sp. MJM1172 TaxID=1703926 RepID=UPI000A861089
MQATRSSRAANRSVASWARDNAAYLRRLAGRRDPHPPARRGLRTADRIDAVTRHTDRLRQDTRDQRGT